VCDVAECLSFETAKCMCEMGITNYINGLAGVAGKTAVSEQHLYSLNKQHTC